MLLRVQMYGSWQLLSRTRHRRASSDDLQAESLRFSLGHGDSIRFSRTVERRSVIQQDCQALLKAKYSPRAMPVQHSVTPEQLVQEYHAK